LAFGQVGGKKLRQVRSSCLFCWYWRNCWPSLSKLSLQKKIFIKRILHVTKEKIGPNLELFQPVTKQFFDI